MTQNPHIIENGRQTEADSDVISSGSKQVIGSFMAIQQPKEISAITRCGQFISMYTNSVTQYTLQVVPVWPNQIEGRQPFAIRMHE